jgi:hypothetical protein
MEVEYMDLIIRFGRLPAPIKNFPLRIGRTHKFGPYLLEFCTRHGKKWRQEWDFQFRCWIQTEDGPREEVILLRWDTRPVDLVKKGLALGSLIEVKITDEESQAWMEGYDASKLILEVIQEDKAKGIDPLKLADAERTAAMIEAQRQFEERKATIKKRTDDFLQEFRKFGTSLERWADWADGRNRDFNNAVVVLRRGFGLSDAADAQDKAEAQDEVEVQDVEVHDDAEIHAEAQVHEDGQVQDEAEAQDEIKVQSGDRAVPQKQQRRIQHANSSDDRYQDEKPHHEGYQIERRQDEHL